MSLKRQGRHYLAIGIVQWLLDWGVMVGLSHLGLSVELANIAGRISGATSGLLAQRPHHLRRRRHPDRPPPVRAFRDDVAADHVDQHLGTGGDRRCRRPEVGVAGQARRRVGVGWAWIPAVAALGLPTLKPARRLPPLRCGPAAGPRDGETSPLRRRLPEARPAWIEAPGECAAAGALFACVSRRGGAGRRLRADETRRPRKKNAGTCRR